jgi:hypothetical protein
MTSESVSYQSSAITGQVSTHVPPTAEHHFGMSLSESGVMPE